jgi:hypothetical protein
MWRNAYCPLWLWPVEPRDEVPCLTITELVESTLNLLDSPNGRLLAPRILRDQLNVALISEPSRIPTHRPGYRPDSDCHRQKESERRDGNITEIACLVGSLRCFNSMFWLVLAIWLLCLFVLGLVWIPWFWFFCFGCWPVGHLAVEEPCEDCVCYEPQVRRDDSAPWKWQ